MKTATITADGRVTLPEELRERADLRPGDEVSLSPLVRGVRIEKVTPPATEAGTSAHETEDGSHPTAESDPVARLSELEWDSDLPTDELMRLTRGDDE